MKKAILAAGFCMTALMVQQSVAADVMLFKQHFKGLKGVAATESETPPPAPLTDTTADANSNLKATISSDYAVINQSEQSAVTITGSGIDADVVSGFVKFTDGVSDISASLIDNAVAAVDGQVDNDARWSMPVMSIFALNDGPITGQLVVTDANGNQAFADVTYSVGTFNLTNMTKDTVVDAEVSIRALTDNEDDYVSSSEYAGDISVYGNVTNDGADGASIIVRLNGTDYTGRTFALDESNGIFNISVPGSAFVSDSDRTVDVIAIVEDSAGNTKAISASRAYTVQ